MKAAGALVPLAREARKLLRSDKYSAGISEEKRRFKGRTDLSYYGTPNVVHLANCLALLVETAGRQKGIFGKRLPLESFERYARRVLTGKVITEIGCGGGSLALVLQDLGSKVQGVEYYKELAEFARNRGIHVVRGVAHRLDQYESLGPPHFIISNNVFSADLYLPPELRNK